MGAVHIISQSRKENAEYLDQLKAIPKSEYLWFEVNGLDIQTEIERVLIRLMFSR